MVLNGILKLVSLYIQNSVFRTLLSDKSYSLIHITRKNYENTKKFLAVENLFLAVVMKCNSSVCS